MVGNKPSLSGGMPPDDLDIVELLHQAFSKVQPSDEFIASVADRLDAEFHAFHNASAQNVSSQIISSASEPHTENNIDVNTAGYFATIANTTVPAKHPGLLSRVLPISNANLKDDSEITNSSEHSILSTDRKLRSTHPYRKRGLLTAVAIAISALVATVIWTTRPSYSWATMLRALDTQPWIHMAMNQPVSETNRPGRVLYWFSSEHGVAATKSANQAIFDDLANGVRDRYQADKRIITRSPLPDHAPISTEAILLRFMLRGIGQKDSSLDEAINTGKFNIGRQSWRRIEDAEGKWIELSVEVFWGENDESRLNLVLLLDPHTKLPRQCRVVNESIVHHFEYPREGPRNVYKLDVPQDATIVDSALSALPSHKIKPLQKSNNKTQSQDDPATKNTTAADKSNIATPAEMARRIDALLDACWAQHKIQPATLASNEEFARRAHLDLTGRIPGVSEARQYINANSSEAWREKLIEDLLARQDHATHLAAVWRKFLFYDGVDLTRYGGSVAFDSWLAERFHDNLPYDAIVRELLLAEGRVKESGPMLFFAAMQFKPEAIAAQTARAFMGVRMECAQCHDHSFDKRWKQKDFWGYAAFFSRISRPDVKIGTISPVLRVHDNQQGEVMLPDSDEIIAPRIPLGESIADESDGVTRRQRLANWLTAADNPHFARATVNRVWCQLFGHAVVNPVDDMREDNQAICPELLDELAAYFVANGFDLRQLFRAIALSKAYQLSSSSSEKYPYRTQYFAQMNIKTMTPEQLYDSISMATRLEPPSIKANAEKDLRISDTTRRAFIEHFYTLSPGQFIDYQAGIPQALSMMNGHLIHNATDLKYSGILQSLQAPFLSDSQRLEVLFLSTFSRQPRDDEREALLKQIRTADNNEDKQVVLADMLWALLNSAEFIMNH